MPRIPIETTIGLYQKIGLKVKHLTLRINGTQRYIFDFKFTKRMGKGNAS